MSRIKSAFLGSISAQFYLVVSMLLSILATPLFLKYLSSEEYGVSIVLFQIIIYFSLFDLGVGVAITRFLALNKGDSDDERAQKNRILSTTFFLYIFIGLLIVFLGLTYSTKISLLFDVSDKLEKELQIIVRIISIVIGVQFPLKIFSNVFYAHQRQIYSNTIGFFTTIINILVSLFLVYLGKGIMSFLFATIISSTFNLVLTSLLVRKNYPYINVRFEYFDLELLTKIFRFSFFVFLGTIANQIVFNTDRVVIGSVVSILSVPAFSLTTRIPEIASNLIFKITESSLPAMVEISSRGSKEEFAFSYQRLMTINVCLSTIAFWIILIFDEWFIKLWVGSYYFAGTEVLLLSLLILFLHCTIYVHTTCLNSFGKIKGLSIMTFIDAILNIILSIGLAKELGISGVLLGTIISSILTVQWYIPYRNYKLLNISIRDFFLKPIILPGLKISFLGFPLFLLFDNLYFLYRGNWLLFLLLIGIVTTIFFIFAWVFYFRPYFKNYFFKLNPF